MTDKMIGRNRTAEIFGTKFEIVDDGLLTGEYNMEFDFRRTMAVAEGKEIPMFRFYGWKPWAVSLGANQNEDSIDKNKCLEHGVDIVRRPTGGRAVLHADELTYSVVMPVSENSNVHKIYKQIHSILLEGLKLSGASELEFVQSQKDFSEFYKNSPMSVSCFASSARYEISWQGKKIVGSAQRLFGRTLLQHGSILLGTGHELLGELTAGKSDDEKRILLNYIRKHSVSLEEICNRKIGFEECKKNMLKAVGIYFEIQKKSQEIKTEK
ncbi:MAG: lipoate--protein ligase family protein [Bacteroidota bacterium]